MGNPQGGQEHSRGTMAVGDPYQSEGTLQGEDALKGLQSWVTHAGAEENQ